MKTDPENLANVVAQLNARVQLLEQAHKKFEDSSQYTFQKDIQILDGRKIRLGGNQGTKIGVSTSKIGLYGVTPVVKANSIAQATTAGATYNQTTAQTWVDAINNIRIALTNIGITG